MQVNKMKIHTQLIMLGAIMLLGCATGDGTSTATEARMTQDIEGSWEGSIEVAGISLGIIVAFEVGEELSAKIDIPQQGAKGIPLEKVTVDGETVHFELPAGPGLAVFHGTISEGVIEGTFSQGGVEGTFQLGRGAAKTAAPEYEPRENEYLAVLETATGEIHGTFKAPAQRAPPYPAVLIIAGSGPTDRNGNSALLQGNNDNLMMLADALSEAGYASLRYDKRGIGKSAAALTRESEIRFHHYVSDAAQWIGKLRDDKNIRGIAIAGLSEGALVGLAAATETDVDAYVSLAGVGRRADELLKEQYSMSDETIRDSAYEIIDALAEGTPVSDVPNELAGTFRSSVQPYIISWFQYDPVALLRTLEIPVLITQGTSDLQVTVKDAELLAGANPNAKLTIIDGMNHMLKQVGDDLSLNQQSYVTPDIPLDPALVKEVVSFLIENVE